MKQGEIDYIKNLGLTYTLHALNKPYSDDKCGLYLMDIGSIIQLLPPIPAKILDMGCGTGWTSVFYAKRGYNVTGQDISQDMIDLAKINKVKSNLDNLEFMVSDYELMNIKNEFDCVVFYDSLHHAENENRALEVAYNALKSNGILITLEPGEGHSKSQPSLEAVQKYGVEEKDMPPYHIIDLCKGIGFKKFIIFSRYSSDEMRILFNSENKNQTNPVCQLINSFRRSLGEFKRNVLNSNRPPIILRASNIVVSYKGCVS